MENNEFPTVSALVRYIHERSEEIKKAFVIPPGIPFFENGVELIPAGECFLIFLRVAYGDPIVVGDDAAEAIINNGILNRMHIKIELWKGPVAEAIVDAVTLPPIEAAPPAPVPPPRPKRPSALRLVVPRDPRERAAAPFR